VRGAGSKRLEMGFRDPAAQRHCFRWRLAPAQMAGSSPIERSGPLQSAWVLARSRNVMRRGPDESGASAKSRSPSNPVRVGSAKAARDRRQVPLPAPTAARSVRPANGPSRFAGTAGCRRGAPRTIRRQIGVGRWDRSVQPWCGGFARAGGRRSCPPELRGWVRSRLPLAAFRLVPTSDSCPLFFRFFDLSKRSCLVTASA
jgi:hypothetical protein